MRLCSNEICLYYNQADQTIGYIRNAFIENLQTIDWMDKKTKQAAEAKVYE